jgi:hypothetical protein
MRNGLVRLVVFAAVCALLAFAQERQNPGAAVKAQFFAGIITEVDATHITVSRSVGGRSPEQHTFLINSQTKIGKTLRTKQRVTVRYAASPDGDVALEILVRTQKALRAG